MSESGNNVRGNKYPHFGSSLTKLKLKFIFKGAHTAFDFFPFANLLLACSVQTGLLRFELSLWLILFGNLLPILFNYDFVEY